MIRGRNSKFKAEILSTPGGETLQRCYQCGSCTGGCPTGAFTSFRVRTIIHKCLLGLRDAVVPSKDVWLCTLCYTCHERCPTGVEVTDVMLALRNLAAKEGYAPDSLKSVLKSVFETGHAFPFTGYTKKLRVQLGLAEELPLAVNISEARLEVQKLINITKANHFMDSEERK